MSLNALATLMGRCIEHVMYCDASGGVVECRIDSVCLHWHLTDLLRLLQRRSDLVAKFNGDTCVRGLDAIAY